MDRRPTVYNPNDSRMGAPGYVSNYSIINLVEITVDPNEVTSCYLIMQLVKYFYSLFTINYLII